MSVIIQIRVNKSQTLHFRPSDMFFCPSIPVYVF